MVKTTIITFMLVCMSLMFIACGPKPDEAVKGFLEASKKADINTMNSYIKIEGDNQAFKYDSKEQEKIVKANFSKISYEIMSSKVNGKDAIVKTKITSVDLPAIYSKVVTNTMPILVASASNDKSKEVEAQLTQEFLNAINAADVKKITSEVDIKLTKGDKNWIIEANDDLFNAITGNLVKAFEKDKMNSTSKPDPKIYGLNKEAKMGRASFTVTKFELSEGKEFDKPKEGYIFAVVNVKKKNISKDTLKHSESDFKIQTDKNEIIDTSIHSIGKRFGEDKLSGGGENDGNIVFEVPKDSKSLTLLYYPEEEALLKFKLK